MKIYTSYFAQLRNFPPNLIGFSTAIWNPKWLLPGRDKNGAIWLDIPLLKPGPQCAGLCNGKCSPKHPEDCAFLRTYREQLNQLDFNAFIKKIEQNTLRIAQAENLTDVAAALLVYETPTNPCSERKIIQEWFSDNGYKITEWHLEKN